MPSFNLLDRAAGEFETRLRLVSDAQRDLPTPCEGLSVTGLVAHQVIGMRGFTLLVEGRPGEGAAALEAEGIGSPDWLDAFCGAYEAMREAFDAPGALERSVTHPLMGEIPASMLFEIRIGELAIHAWDLARAIGADETLDSELIAALWAFAKPIEGMLASLGVFGTGASGTVGESAPLQTRLLDLLGRRP